MLCSVPIAVVFIIYLQTTTTAVEKEGRDSDVKRAFTVVVVLKQQPTTMMMNSRIGSNNISSSHGHLATCPPAMAQ